MKVWCEHQLHFLGKSSTWGPEIQLYLHFDILSPEKTQQCSPWGKGIQHCQAIWAFSHGWKIPLLPNVLQHCIEWSREGKWGMPCLRSNKAIARNHPDKKPALLRKVETFLHYLPEPKSSTCFLFLLSLDELSITSCDSSQMCFTSSLIFPLSRSPLFDLPLPLIPGTSLIHTRRHRHRHRHTHAQGSPEERLWWISLLEGCKAWNKWEGC